MTDENLPSTSLRDLLGQVAAGAVDPAEAARRLSEPGPASATQASGVRVLPNPPATGSAWGPGDEQPIDRVVVRATANKLILLADPAVSGALVEGTHVARREGGTLVIDTDAEPADGDFAFETSAPGRFARKIGRWSKPETVIVKVRPDLPVEAAVTAGSVIVDGLRGGLRFSVDAGSLKAKDCSGPVDGRVASGSATLDWRVDSGSSRLRCELGSIKVHLDPRSDVTVRARSELGSMQVGSAKSSGANGTRELVVGAGAATLDIEVSLGSLQVAVG